MAWFSLAKIAMQAGAKIYSNRQKTKMAMSDAQLMHAEKMARGEEAYQGKLFGSKAIGLERRIRFDYIVGSDNSFGLGGPIGRSGCNGEGEVILRVLLYTTVMVYKPVDPCRGEYF